MIAAPDALSFVAHLKASGLLTQDQLVEAAAFAVRSSARQIAQGLVRLGRLTLWQAQQLLAGRSRFDLANYRLLRPLGKGAMGVVYLGEHVRLHRRAAVKVLKRTLLGNATAVARFHREIRNLSRLDHPAVVRAYDAGCVQGNHFLAMEYVDGLDLKSVLAGSGRLPLRWVCECIRQVALGLQHAHDHGLVHRDVKPANILVQRSQIRERPRAKLADLGLARMTEEDTDRPLTQLGNVAGTPDYIAPEQATHRDGATSLSDIYALGCTLFHLLTGRVPFPAGHYLDRIRARFEQEPPRVSSVRADLPAGLDAIVGRMLARNPRERFPSAAQVADALAPFGLQPALALARVNSPAPIRRAVHSRGTRPIQHSP